jgi:hypothetical protein
VYFVLTISSTLEKFIGNSVRKSLQAHDQVNSLLTAVRNFESKFADALVQQHQQAARQKGTSDRGTSGARTAVNVTAASTASSAEQEQHALLSERVLLLSGALRSYVGSEAQCVKFLSERVETAQGKLATARKELLAYAALSMKVRFVVAFVSLPCYQLAHTCAYCFVTTVPTGLHRADHRGSGRTAERRDC